MYAKKKNWRKTSDNSAREVATPVINHGYPPIHSWAYTTTAVCNNNNNNNNNKNQVKTNLFKYIYDRVKLINITHRKLRSLQRFINAKKKKNYSDYFIAFKKASIIIKIDDPAPKNPTTVSPKSLPSMTFHKWTKSPETISSIHA